LKETYSGEQTTGYGAWLMRQPEFSEAGPLVRAVREDLTARRLARTPGTVREVEKWLLSRPVCPPPLAVALRSTVPQWRNWLRSLAEEEKPESDPITGRPNDNPFATASAGTIQLDDLTN
jgi:hypothetical protein